MHQALYEELVRVARNADLTTYADIAPMAGLDMGNPAHRNEMARLLGEISTYEHQQGRPLLSAVVVHRAGRTPGQGFFKLARELGLPCGQGDIAELTFFSSELRRVHAEWADR